MSRQNHKKSFTVREAQLTDMPTVMLLIYKYLDDVEKEELRDEAHKDQIRWTVYKAFFAHEITVVVTEAAGKTIVGYGVFDLRPDIFGDSIAWGHHVYFLPNFRRRGLTGRMLQFAEELARKANAKKFFIDTAFPTYFKKHFGYKDLYSVVVKDLRQEIKHVE